MTKKSLILLAIGVSCCIQNMNAQNEDTELYKRIEAAVLRQLPQKSQQQQQNEAQQKQQAEAKRQDYKNQEVSLKDIKGSSYTIGTGDTDNTPGGTAYKKTGTANGADLQRGATNEDSKPGMLAAAWKKAHDFATDIYSRAKDGVIEIAENLGDLIKIRSEKEETQLPSVGPLDMKIPGLYSDPNSTQTYGNNTMINGGQVGNTDKNQEASNKKTKTNISNVNTKTGNRVLDEANGVLITIEGQGNNKSYRPIKTYGRNYISTNVQTGKQTLIKSGYTSPR